MTKNETLTNPSDDLPVEPPTTAIVDPATNLFCEDGWQPGRICIPVPRNPDPTREKFSGRVDDPFKPLSKEERQGHQTLRDARRADEQWQALPQMNAFATAVLWTILNREPTPAELIQFKTRFRAASAR